MFEPQSPVLFVLLVVAFGALMWWMLITDRAALRILAACLAFTLAMLCGVMAVNKYYGYYQTWPAAIGDLTNQGANAAPQMPDRGLLSRSRLGTPDSTEIYRGLARRLGYTLRLKVAGQRSHITRAVYVYLPPQYFQPRYTSYRFPVIELIHGQPGEPQDWINVVGVTDTLDHLVNENLAQPVVLVMPDANGGANVSLQCLDQVGGPQDPTYLAVDLPDQITHLIRVQPPGPAWGVAGYSEGGFCAANMALRFPSRYGDAGCFPATSNRSTTSWRTRSGRSTRSAATTRWSGTTPRLTRCRMCQREQPSPDSGWARAQLTSRTWRTPSSSGR